MKWMISTTASIVSCLMIVLLRLAVCQVEPVQESANQKSLTKTVYKHDVMQIDFRSLFPTSRGEVCFKQFSPDDYHESDRAQVFSLKQKIYVLLNSTEDSSCLRLLRVGDSKVLAMHTDYSFSLHEVSPRTGQRTELQAWRLESANLGLQFLGYFRDESNEDFAYILWNSSGAETALEEPGDSSAQLTVTEICLRTDRTTAAIRNTTFACRGCRTDRLKLVVDSLGVKAVLIYGHRDSVVSLLQVDLEHFRFAGEASLPSNELTADSFEVITTPRGLYLYTLDISISAASREVTHTHSLVPLSLEKNTLTVRIDLLIQLSKVDFFAEKEEFTKPLFIMKLTNSAENYHRLAIAVRGSVFELGVGDDHAIGLISNVTTANSPMQYQSITSLELASDGSYLLVLESDRCLYVLVVDPRSGILRHSRHIDPQSMQRGVQSPVLLVDGPTSPNHLLVTCDAVKKYDPRDIAVGRFEQYSGRVTGLMASADGQILRYDIEVIDDLATILLPNLIFNPILISNQQSNLSLQIKGNRHGIKANNLTVSLQLPRSTRRKPGVQLSFEELSWKRLVWDEKDPLNSFLKNVKWYAYDENMIVGFDREGKGRLFQCSLLTPNPKDNRCIELEFETNSLSLDQGHLIKGITRVPRNGKTAISDLLLITSNDTASEIQSFQEYQEGKFVFRQKSIYNTVRIIDGEFRYNLRMDLDFIGVGQSLQTGEYSIYTLKVQFNTDIPIIGTFVPVEIRLKYPYVPFSQLVRSHREAVYLLQTSEETEPQMVLTWFQLRPQPQTSQYITEEVASSVIEQDTYRAIDICEEGILLEDRAKQGLLLRSLVGQNIEDSYLFPFPWQLIDHKMLIATLSQYCLIVIEDQGYLYDLSKENRHPLNRLIRSFRLDFNTSEDISKSIAVMFVSYPKLQIVICSEDRAGEMRCAAFSHDIKALIFSLEMQKPFKVEFIETTLHSSPVNSLTSVLPLVRKTKPSTVKAHPITPNNPIYDSQGLPITYKLSSLLAVRSQIVKYEVEQPAAGILEVTNTVTQLSATDSQKYLDKILPDTNGHTQTIYKSNKLVAVSDNKTVAISIRKEVIHNFSIQLDGHRGDIYFDLIELSDVILLIAKYHRGQGDITAVSDWRFYVMGYSSGSKLSYAMLDTGIIATRVSCVLEDTTKRKQLVLGQREIRQGRRYIIFSIIRLTAVDPSLPIDSGFLLSFHPDVFVFEPDFVVLGRVSRSSANTLISIIFGSNTNQVIYLRFTVDLDDLKVTRQTSVAPRNDFIISLDIVVLGCSTDLVNLSFTCYIKSRRNRLQIVEFVFSMDGNYALSIFESEGFMLPQDYDIKKVERGNYNILIEAQKEDKSFCFLFDRATRELIQVVECNSSMGVDGLLKEIDSQHHVIGYVFQNGTASGQVFRKAKASLKFTQPSIRQDALFNSYLKLTDANGKVKSIPLALLFTADSSVPSWMLYLAACILSLGLLSAILLCRYNMKKYSMHFGMPATTEEIRLTIDVS